MAFLYMLGALQALEVPAMSSAVVEAAKKKTEAYLPAIDAQRCRTVASTDLEGAVPYQKKYVGECRQSRASTVYPYQGRSWLKMASVEHCLMQRSLSWVQARCAMSTPRRRR